MFRSCVGQMLAGGVDDKVKLSNLVAVQKTSIRERRNGREISRPIGRTLR